MDIENDLENNNILRIFIERAIKPMFDVERVHVDPPPHV